MKLRRRNRIILISICVLILSLIGPWWWYADTDDLSKVKLPDSLSKQDAAAINAAVKRQMWREALPDFSWNSIRQFPAGVKRCFGYRLDSIERGNFQEGRTNPNLFAASLSPRQEKEGNINEWPYPYYRVERLTNGWKVTPLPQEIL